MKTTLRILSLLLTVPLFGSRVGEVEHLIYRGMLEEASTAIEELKKADESSLDAEYLKARLATAQGDFEAGVTGFRSVIEKSPETAQYHAALGMVLVRWAETQPFMERPAAYMESIECFQHSVKLDPDCFEGQIGLANYYFYAPEIAGGSLFKAERHAREVMRLNEPVGVPLLAQILKKAQKKEALETLLSDQVERHPGSAEAHLALGEFLAAEGQTEAARRHYTRVLEIDAANTRAEELLSQLETVSAE